MHRLAERERFRSLISSRCLIASGRGHVCVGGMMDCILLIRAGSKRETETGIVYADCRLIVFVGTLALDGLIGLLYVRMPVEQSGHDALRACIYITPFPVPPANLSFAPLTSFGFVVAFTSTGIQ